MFVKGDYSYGLILVISTVWFFCFSQSNYPICKCSPYFPTRLCLLLLQSLDYEVSDNIMYQNEEKDKSTKKWVSHSQANNMSISFHIDFPLFCFFLNFFVAYDYHDYLLVHQNAWRWTGCVHDSCDFLPDHGF